MWPNPQEYAELVTFTEEILNEKLHFLCSVSLLDPLAQRAFGHLSWFEFSFNFLRSIQSEMSTSYF